MLGGTVGFVISKRKKKKKEEDEEEEAAEADEELAEAKEESEDISTNHDGTKRVAKDIQKKKSKVEAAKERAQSALKLYQMFVAEKVTVIHLTHAPTQPPTHPRLPTAYYLPALSELGTWEWP